MNITITVIRFLSLSSFQNIGGGTWQLKNSVFPFFLLVHELRRKKGQGKEEEMKTEISLFFWYAYPVRLYGLKRMRLRVFNMLS